MILNSDQSITLRNVILKSQRVLVLSTLPCFIICSIVKAAGEVVLDWIHTSFHTDYFILSLICL